MLKIILFIIGGVLAIILLCVIIAYLRGKHNSKKLDENIKKLNAEKKQFDAGGKLTISSNKDKNIPEEAIIEDIGLEEDKEVDEKAEQNVKPEAKDIDLADENESNMLSLDEDFLRELKSRPKRIRKNLQDLDDFEHFLDEHSFTRRVLDKNILRKIQKLPPEIKAIVISNIFTRPQD